MLPVQWFWAAPGAPLLGHHRFGTLHYSMPVPAPGDLGEDVDSPRPWRNGSIPDFVGPNSTHTVVGSPAAFRDGASGKGDRWKIRDFKDRFFPNLDPVRRNDGPLQPNVLPVPRFFPPGQTLDGFWVDVPPPFHSFWEFGAEPVTWFWEGYQCGGEVGPGTTLTAVIVGPPTQSIRMELELFDPVNHLLFWGDPTHTLIPAGQQALLWARGL